MYNKTYVYKIKMILETYLSVYFCDLARDFL